MLGHQSFYVKGTSGSWSWSWPWTSLGIPYLNTAVPFKAMEHTVMAFACHPSTWEVGMEDLQFKVNLSYLQSSEPAWAT